MIAYLAFFEGYTVDEAIELVKTKRPITYPNRGNKETDKRKLTVFKIACLECTQIIKTER